MKTDNIEKNIMSSNPLGMPTLEPAWAGIPPLILSPNSTEEMPTLIDKAHCGKEYRVEDGEIYTIRLGMHSHPGGLGAFTKESLAICEIPTTISKRHPIIAMFATPEIYPALFMDHVSLNAEKPFRLELIKGSAILMCNNGTEGLPLGDDDMNVEEDLVIISQSALSDKTPDYLNYTYDFIAFQVRVATEIECILRKQVRLIDGEGEEWHNSVTAHIGDMVEFRVQYTNSSGSPQKVTILEDLPPCLECVKCEAFLCSPETPEGKPIDSSMFVASGMEIGSCKPEETVAIHYTAEVVDYPPEDQQGLVWNWTEVLAGHKVLENYAEVVIDAR